QSLTAISSPTRARRAETSVISIIALLARLNERRSPSSGALHLVDRRFRIESTSFSGQPLEERRRLPIIAEAGAVFLHAREHDVEEDGIGVIHRPAATAQDAEAVTRDDSGPGG